jgi:hypothetical protein
VSRLEKAAGLALVVVGAGAIWWKPLPPPARRGRVLVLLDSAVERDPGVREVFVDPGPPSRADAPQFALHESAFERWGAPEVAAIATEAGGFDAVVVVSDGRAAIDADAARDAGARLAAGAVPVSVVLVPRAPLPGSKREPPPPLRPARTARVLYVEQSPRWEYHFLSNAMCRDPDLLAHTWIADAAPETPQRKSQRPDWPAIDLGAGLPSPAAMDAYDVLVLGDVGVAALRGPDTPGRDVAAEVRAWVEGGHGVLVIAGPQRMPAEWTSTALMDALPVVPVPAGPARDPASGFHLALTSGGAANPILDIAADPSESRRMWESTPAWEMFWASPTKLAAGATALALVGDDLSVPAIAMRDCGKGRVLWIGVDELWRIRADAGDRWFWRFYGTAIAWLAEPKAGVVPVPPVAPPPPGPSGAEALRALVQASGGRVCTPDESRDLVASLAQLRGPAPPAPSRDPWVIAGGAAAALCGAFFLLRGRAT